MPTSKSNNKVIGITLGDPGGIGPEVTAKALKKFRQTPSTRFMVIGDQCVFKQYSTTNRRDVDFVDVKFITPKNWKQGQISALNGQASLHYLTTALELLNSKKISALVTAPVSKEGIIRTLKNFTGHTEFLARHSQCKSVGMMFVGKSMRTIIVTRHIPLKKVPAAINKNNVLETILLAHTALKTQFHIERPRIAVCGLNPHAGEGGTMGSEEITAIIPAIQKARQMKMQVAGPFAADTLFRPISIKEYDCIVAMYHDQGLIPIKSLYFNQVVNLTVGLPYVRTSPAHGTAFDIAGKNTSDPSSMLEAIKLAIQLSP